MKLFSLIGYILQSILPTNDRLSLIISHIYYSVLDTYFGFELCVKLIYEMYMNKVSTKLDNGGFEF